MRICIAILLLVSVMAATAYAACTTPSAQAGGIIFSTTTNTVQYCNGTNWINTGPSYPAAAQTGCTSPAGMAGDVIYAAPRGVVQFCNGANWVDTACAASRTPGGSGCTSPAGTAGQIQYAANHNELQFCDSTNWVAMGWGCAAGAPPPAQAEVVAYVSSNVNNLNVQTLFSGADWADTDKRKRVVINTGVVVGSSNPANAALQSGTARGNVLVIHNSGTIAGAGGTANGGAGGAAIQTQQADITIVNSGNIYGGGGGGGQGGNGGSGTIQTAIREPSTGELYEPSGNGNAKHWWNSPLNGKSFVMWGDDWMPFAQGPLGATSLVYNGYTYYRGSYRLTVSGDTYYGIYRTYTGDMPTVGGTGGAGGRGQGTDGSAAAGLAGSAGGTNAGAGGAGGAGGAFGVAGTAGATGVAGNNGAGLAGNAGGAAGAAITGSGYTLTNTGTVLGTY